MKKLLMILFLFTLQLQAQELKPYIVYPGQTHPDNTWADEKLQGDTFEFPFVLDVSWKQIANDTSNRDAQKIGGVGSITQNKSVRLAVRRGDGKNKTKGLVAVDYYHTSWTSKHYPPILDKYSKPLFLFYDSLYYCKIFKSTGCWIIEIYQHGNLLGWDSAPIDISSFIYRKKMGIWIEGKDDKPSPYLIKTLVGL